MSGCRGFRPPPPALPQATLQANLATAQAAYQQLVTGGQVATVSYAEGSGMRSVTYTRAQLGDLVAYIESLQTQLGYRARRAIGLRF